MILLIPLAAVLIGVVIGLLVNHPFTGELGQYIAIACLAAMDTVFGGIRSGIEGKFRTDIFVTGFISNIIIATLLAWIGDKIYIDLFLAIALIFGGRIFLNLSQIRRGLVNDWNDRKQRRKLASEALVQPSPSPLSSGTISNSGSISNTNSSSPPGNPASAENR